MSMTREEAIALFEKQLTAAQVVLDSGFGSNPGENNSLYRRRKEMAEIALSALRPVSREQYHNLWKNAGNCTLDINPDVVCDFTDLPFPDNSFPLVVFDPPHLTGAKETAWLVKKYGKLDENWPKMLHDGFRECMRVLKPDGVLIFKWSEYDIPAAEVWKAIGQKPLFGHHSGKQSRTFWGCFMKVGGDGDAG